MKGMIERYGALLLSLVFIAACLLFLSIVDGTAGSRRRLPSRNIRAIIQVSTQAEIYRAYRNAGLKGAHVVQFGRHFHLEAFFPYEKISAVPFPIETFDVRPLYERGVDSHSWLFIANKNGLVRKVTTVLPDSVFAEKVDALESDFAFVRHRAGYRGYSYDLPRAIFPFSNFDCPQEPVVVNVDAESFTDTITPRSLYALLQQRCPDIRMFLLVDSKDNGGITEQMRRDLSTFRNLMERNHI